MLLADGDPRLVSPSNIIRFSALKENQVTLYSFVTGHHMRPLEQCRHDQPKFHAARGFPPSRNEVLLNAMAIHKTVKGVLIEGIVLGQVIVVVHAMEEAMRAYGW